MPTWVEVSLSWGNTPLLVHHLKSPSGYVLHDVPGDASGLEVIVEHDGRMAALVPDDATVTLVVDGRVMFRRDALRAGLLVRDARHEGAALFTIERGRRCRFEARGLVVQVEGVAGEATTPNLRPRLTRTDWIILAISAVLHVAAIAAIFVTTPSLP